MLLLFPVAFRLYLTGLALLVLGAVGLPHPVAAAPTATVAPEVTVAQAQRNERTPAALLAQPEALGQQAVAPRGPGLPLAGPPFSGVLLLPLAWKYPAALAARATPLRRAGGLPNDSRARLLRAALSPQAP